MNAKPIVGALAALLVLSVATMPAAAAVGSADGPAVDECKNADHGPDGDGPPGFVAGITPDFLSGLMSDLPVPNFVKSAFGAETC